MDHSNNYIQKEVKKQIHQNEDKNIQVEELDTWICEQNSKIKGRLK